MKTWAWFKPQGYMKRTVSKFLDIRYVFVQSEVEFTLALLGELGVKSPSQELRNSRFLDLTLAIGEQERQEYGITYWPVIYKSRKHLVLYLGIYYQVNAQLHPSGFVSLEEMKHYQFFTLEQVRTILGELNDNALLTCLRDLELAGRRHINSTQYKDTYYFREDITALAIQGIGKRIKNNVETMIQRIMDKINQHLDTSFLVKNPKVTKPSKKVPSKEDELFPTISVHPPKVLHVNTPIVSVMEMQEPIGARYKILADGTRVLIPDNQDDEKPHNYEDAVLSHSFSDYQGVHMNAIRMLMEKATAVNDLMEGVEQPVCLVMPDHISVSTHGHAKKSFHFTLGGEESSSERLRLENDVQKLLVEAADDTFVALKFVQPHIKPCGEFLNPYYAEVTSSSDKLKEREEEWRVIVPSALSHLKVTNKRLPLPELRSKLHLSDIAKQLDTFISQGTKRELKPTPLEQFLDKESRSTPLLSARQIEFVKKNTLVVIRSLAPPWLARYFWMLSNWEEDSNHDAGTRAKQVKMQDVHSPLAFSIQGFQYAWFKSKIWNKELKMEDTDLNPEGQSSMITSLLVFCRLCALHPHLTVLGRLVELYDQKIDSSKHDFLFNDSSMDTDGNFLETVISQVWDYLEQALFSDESQKITSAKSLYLVQSFRLLLLMITPLDKFPSNLIQGNSKERSMNQYLKHFAVYCIDHRLSQSFEFSPEGEKQLGAIAFHLLAKTLDESLVAFDKWADFWSLLLVSLNPADPTKGTADLFQFYPPYFLGLDKESASYGGIPATYYFQNLIPAHSMANKWMLMQNGLTSETNLIYPNPPSDLYQRRLSAQKSLYLSRLELTKLFLPGPLLSNQGENELLGQINFFDPLLDASLSPTTLLGNTGLKGFMEPLHLAFRRLSSSSESSPKLSPLQMRGFALHYYEKVLDSMQQLYAFGHKYLIKNPEDQAVNYKYYGIDAKIIFQNLQHSLIPTRKRLLKFIRVHFDRIHKMFGELNPFKPVDGLVDNLCSWLDTQIYYFPPELTMVTLARLTDNEVFV